MNDLVAMLEPWQLKTKSQGWLAVNEKAAN